MSLVGIAQLAEMISAADHGVPQNHAVSEPLAGRCEERQRGSQAGAHEAGSLATGPPPAFPARGVHVPQPLGDAPVSRVTGGISRSRVVEAEHGEPGARQRDGKLPEGPVSSDVFMSDRLAEHDRRGLSVWAQRWVVAAEERTARFGEVEGVVSARGFIHGLRPEVRARGRPPHHRVGRTVPDRA